MARSTRSKRSQRHHKAIQEQAKAVLDQHGVKLFRAQVGGVFADGKVNLRRERNRRPGEIQAAADGVPSVRLDPSQELAVGDYVWCLQHSGHSFVLGRVVSATDRVMTDKLDKTGGTLTGKTQIAAGGGLEIRNPDAAGTGVSAQDFWRIVTGSNGELFVQWWDNGPSAQIFATKLMLTRAGVMTLAGEQVATREWVATTEVVDAPLRAGWSAANPVRLRKVKGGIIKAYGRVRNVSGVQKASGSPVFRVPPAWIPEDNQMWACAHFALGASAPSTNLVAPIWLDTTTGDMNTAITLSDGAGFDLANIVWWAP